jgi:hypothetical protein
MIEPLIPKGFSLSKIPKGGIEMIHTVKIMFPLHHQEVQDLQRRLNIKYTELNKYVEGVFPGVTMSISHSGYGKWMLYMVVDAILLLGKPDITEADNEPLKREIKYILWNLFGHSSHYKDHILQRIDFRYDVQVKDKNNRMLLMDLYKKLTDSYRFQKKFLGMLENGTFMPYGTTIYHSSSSIESIVYLKQEEREDKGEKVEYYEKDVVRYEIHVMEDHLYYMERKSEIQRPRKLEAYLKEAVYKEYFQKYMSHIYYPGDFYKIDAAREKLKSSSLSSKDKSKLVQFLKQVSSHSIDTPKKKKQKNEDRTKKISEGTFKKRLAMLQNVGVNPILIPKNYRPKAPSFLENPLNDFLW